MTYTLIVEDKTGLEVAWLPDFESPAQALDHVKTLQRTGVYPVGYEFVIWNGPVLGPLRSNYEHLIWYRPLPFVFDADIAMKMADLGNGPAPTVTGHWE